MNDVTRSTLTVDPGPPAALAALFDDGLPAPVAGDALPPLWHWAALSAWPPASGTGPDGHPRVGGFLPDVGKPRRMFAGGTVTLLGDVLTGALVSREDEVVSVTPKQGRQGDFVLVEVETRLYAAGEMLVLRERRDLIYRDAASPKSRSTTSEVRVALEVVPALLERTDSSWMLHTDPTKLMRFSAAISNGHRIHYDIDWAIAVEGYPGLVVHGPLQTMALAEVLRLDDHRVPRTLTHRGVRPLFCGMTARVERVDEGYERTRMSLVSDAGEHSWLEVAW